MHRDLFASCPQADEAGERIMCKVHVQRPVVRGRTQVEGTEWCSWSRGAAMECKTCEAPDMPGHADSGEVVCDMIRFVFSETTSVHSEERVGRQREGWRVTRAQRTFSKASLCLFSISFPLAGAHRLNEELRGPCIDLPGPNHLKCCSKIVAKLTSTLLTSREAQTQALPSW